MRNRQGLPVRFHVEIDTYNDAVQTPDDCVEVMHEIQRKLDEGIVEANIKDYNGNTIGRFSLK